MSFDEIDESYKKMMIKQKKKNMRSEKTKKVALILSLMKKITRKNNEICIIIQ